MKLQKLKILYKIEIVKIKNSCIIWNYRNYENYENYENLKILQNSLMLTCFDTILYKESFIAILFL